MAEVTCLDGSVLVVRPVPVLDRDGAAYELTLDLLLDGRPFGAVGERCGFFLAAAAERLRGDGPASTLEAGLRRWAADGGQEPDRAWQQLERYLPSDRELFAFLARDPDDLTTVGELRAWLRSQRRWIPGEPRGHWQVSEHVVLDAWGAGGTGVRAVLDRAEALALLDELGRESTRIGASPAS